MKRPTGPSRSLVSMFQVVSPCWGEAAIERNFSSSKVRPPRPTRVWRKMIGEPSSRRTATAVPRSTGASSTRASAETATSRVRLTSIDPGRTAQRRSRTRLTSRTTSTRRARSSPITSKKRGTTKTWYCLSWQWRTRAIVSSSVRAPHAKTTSFTFRSRITRGRARSPPSSGAGSRLAASVALVAGAAAVAGLGTYGSFTSSTSATESVTAGKIELGLANQNQGLAVPVTGMLPGDTAQRAVQLTRAAGSETFGSVTLSVAGEGLLVTDSNGLKLTVEQCSVPWTTTGTGTGPKAMTCGGTTTSVLTQRAVTMTGQALSAGVLSSVNGTGAAANLRITLTLPTAAGNNLQGASSTLNFTFDATQRTGENR